MTTAIAILHVVAGLVVLAEALNKLERTDPLKVGLTGRERAVEGLKALAWLLLALGAGGAAAPPVLRLLGVQPEALSIFARLEQPTIDQTCVLLGFAVLIVRTRLKEG